MNAQSPEPRPADARARPDEEAYFVRDGALLRPTDYCLGPWDAAAMHGGPPSALVVNEALRAYPRTDARLARVTVEILRPVPMVPLRVSSTITRPGRRVELISAALQAGEQEVLRAQMWRVRADPGLRVPMTPPDRTDADTPSTTGPHDGRGREFFGPDRGRDYSHSLDVSFTTGSWRGIGPATAWMRMRVPLVLGEPVHPHSRVLVVADSGNGLSAAVDFEQWLFVNPELTVHLVREPVGEWVEVAARTEVSADGIGLATTALSDPTGPLGRGAQTLFIDRWPDRA